MNMQDIINKEKKTFNEHLSWMQQNYPNVKQDPYQEPKLKMRIEDLSVYHSQQDTRYSYIFKEDRLLLISYSHEGVCEIEKVEDWIENE